MSLVTPIIQRWIDDGRRDPDALWARAAGELPWFRPWDRVFEWNPPTFRWFVGGETNLGYNAVDRHVLDGNGGRAALAYFNECGDRVVQTYAQLLHQVKRISAALRGLGIGKGDRITIYMPPGPESIALMLATVRIGAIHSVVFAGFGARALGDRIVASGSRVVFASDVIYRKGHDVPLLPIVEEAVRSAAPAVGRVVVLERHAGSRRGTHMPWDEFLRQGEGHDSGHAVMESNEPAFILATSGTTATPKLAVHTHGGYQVYVATMGRWCFDLKPRDVWWATSDIGWIVGHSYMVYAPLLAGCTTIAFEGALDYPDAGANWRIAVEEFGASGIFTSPTAVRMLMRYGDEPLRSIDHSRLERIVCAGEVLNAPAWDWLQNTVLRRTRAGDRSHVADRNGRPGLLQPVRPWHAADQARVGGDPDARDRRSGGLAGRPAVRDERKRHHGAEAAVPGTDRVAVGRTGTVRPRLLAADSRRVLQRRRGARRRRRLRLVQRPRRRADQDRRPPHRHDRGRERLSETSGRRRVCRRWPPGRRLRGEVISAFVLLKNGHAPSVALRKAVIATVRHELGPVAVIGELNFVAMLPKTRSGKLMRRVLKAVILDRDPGDITTIEDEGSVDETRQAWLQMKAEIKSV